MCTLLRLTDILQILIIIIIGKLVRIYKKSTIVQITNDGGEKQEKCTQRDDTIKRERERIDM